MENQHGQHRFDTVLLLGEVEGLECQEERSSCPPTTNWNGPQRG